MRLCMSVAVVLPLVFAGIVEGGELLFEMTDKKQGR